MKPESHIYTANVGDQTVTFETGKLAAQAGGSVTVRHGDSIVFAAATMGGIREGIDFFPLTVEYEERMYASGKIPGSFFRREGRPSEDAILTGRLTDRPLRPLFNQEMRNEVQVILFTLSADEIHPLDILAINAASAALMISDIPWAGPVGAVRIGKVNGAFVVNPTFTQIDQGELDLRIAGTREAILMVEAGAKELSESEMLKALEFGHQSLLPLIEQQEKMAAEIGKTKRVIEIKAKDESLFQRVADRITAPLTAVMEAPHTKAQLYDAVDELEAKVVEEFCTEDATLTGAVKAAFEETYKNIVRTRILNESKRPDGRGLKEIRPIWCEVGTSPRAHGSGLFTRGETQVITLATLGTPKEAQEIDTLSPNDTKRYIHHYNFPPYSTGEVKQSARSELVERSVTAPWRNELCSPSSPWKRISPTLSALFPRYWHPMDPARWLPFADPPWH